MKKSKVIIPAMALLLFSTAASITGTVAWFSSTRIFTANASSFKVAQIDGGLVAEMVNGVGTTASDGSDEDTIKEIITVNEHVNLTHGSYNINEDKAYILNRDGSSDVDYRKDLGTEAAARTAEATPFASTWNVRHMGTEYYYVAVSWTINFTYTWNSETNDVGVYLNREASTMKFKQADAEGTANSEGAGTTAKTAYGFRIAFVAATGEKKVWGNNSSAANSLKFASSESKSKLDSYTANNYFTTLATDYDVVEDAADGAADALNIQRPERLCTLLQKSQVGGKTTVAVKCVAWYEGEDLSNVISTAEMDLVDVKMSFYARSDSVKTA